jgi:SAM-dependent methyltransferase
MLNQDVGNWKHNRLSAAPKIWVAGCGTNQAVYTALKFLHAQVLGTDISAQSLDTCHNSARQIGIENLSLEERSLHDILYTDKFDYIICTGVIHHTADPQQALAKLATALKPDGILELMVYNYYHRFLTTAYQKAVLTKKLINTFPAQNAMAHFLANFKNAVEYSYTIASLGELAESCHLELLLPCLNLFDKTENRLSWNTPFEDPEIERSYVALPDTSRWEITNLLIGSDSPILWFYLQRKDSPQPRKTEQEACKEFLDTRFEKYMTH